MEVDGTLWRHAWDDVLRGDVDDVYRCHADVVSLSNSSESSLSAVYIHRFNVQL